MPAPYHSYAALAAEQVEGVDYRREQTTPTGYGWLSMAIHGGRIEPATAEVAAAVAGTRMAYYGFIGTKNANNSDLHITSSEFDEPNLLALFPHVRRTLSFHGMTGVVGVAEVAIGGLDAELVDAVSTALSDAGFDVYAAPVEIAGDNPLNVCNRGMLRHGCQLELSRALRNSFSPDGDIGIGSIFEAGERSETFYTFTSALAGIAPLVLDYDTALRRVDVSGPSPGILDTFSVDFTDSWGYADTGQEWVEVGAATSFSVSGGYGRHSMTAVNTSRYSLAGTGIADFDISASVSTDVLAAGGSHYLSLVGRATKNSGDNCYLARIEFTTAAEVKLTIRKRVAAAESIIGTTYTSGLTHTANGRFSIRFRGMGSALKAKVWTAGDPEPGSWDREVTDSDVTAGDYLGVRSILSSSNTNPLPVGSAWDSFAMRGRVQVEHSPDGSNWDLIPSGANLPAPPTDVDVNHYEYVPDAQNFYRTHLCDIDTDTILVEGDQEVIVPTEEDLTSPPVLTVTEESDGYRVTWSDPGGQAWDDDYVVAEVWRDDCTGSYRIAVVPDALDGSILDLAIPQLDSQPGMVGGMCVDVTETCDITYRVRYWGYVSTYVELPDALPADLILAWPDTAASIPSGWTRVTALDGYHPRGATGVGVPSATGGSASHTHTTPGHTHTIGSHYHGLGGSTGTSNSSATSARYYHAGIPQANQPHSHSRPSSTGSRAAASSGSASPAAASATNAPALRDVIWMESDGTQAQYPVGALAWSTETVAGWEDDVTSSGRFLRGASAGGDGGATSGASSHTHTVASHTHTGLTHTHTLGSTGSSVPVGTDAGDGVATPRWLPRHTHPMSTGSTSTGSLSSASGGTTGGTDLEPPHRRLRTIRNATGGIQTRVIGLYLGDVASLDPLLTVCDGTGGTPDMRGYFCRDVGPDAVGSVGGSTTHTHTTPTHTHGMSSHSHTTSVGASGTGSYEAPTWGDLGSSPTTTHTHTSGSTVSVTPSRSSVTSGTTGSSTHTPPYREVHYVRVDGTIAGGPLPVPELRMSQYASVTVPSLTYGDGLDRIATAMERVAVAADRSHTYPRLVTDSVPLTGGSHAVSVTTAGEDVALVIGTEGIMAMETLERIMSEDAVYFAPAGGTPGWYAPRGWDVDTPAPDVKTLRVTMVRRGWPATADPEDYL